MRRGWTWATVVVAATVLAACGSAPPLPGAEVDATWSPPPGLSGELTLYSANPQKLTDDLAHAFTEATGVKVDVFGAETGKLTAKLDAEWANPRADVVYLASWAPAAKYAAAGRLLEHRVPDAAAVRDDWTGPDDQFVGRDGSALALVVNTKVAPSTPKDWSDLAAPEFRGKVLMPDPRESGTARDLIAAMVAGHGRDKTWALFDELFANGLAVQGANGPALDDVTAGSHAVVLGGVDYSAYTAIDKGEPLQVVSPSSGTTVTPRPVMILRGTENPAAAAAFVDFMMSVQGEQISAAHKMIPGRSDVAVAPGVRPYEDIERLSFTWDQITEIGGDVLAEFTKRYLTR
ncbi:extracellular solute-binding protein [Gordonia humi]|uniref:Iron(III) transport system substrate-binding protein n=1 Tax=Gordonia humi TaxID=686429 RepID=A0A840EVG7_9ACTN|nr:extracellular solute-binding protein [Gordonia humi]MBB4134334.1 iron(III) transport system substrate-binding protein [Gordonia humi]